MTSERDTQQEWSEIGALWQAQPVTPIDPARLRSKVAARSRRLVAMAVAEVASFALVSWVVLRFLLPKPTLQAIDWLVLALAAIAALFTAWAIHDRRGLWRHHGLGPEALVRLEIDRARGAIRYWRANTGVVGLMALVFTAIAAGQYAGWLPPPRRGAWWWLLAASAVMLGSTIAFERWRTTRLKQRLEKLSELARQMQS